MRRRCQWVNRDGLCVMPCMEPHRRELASSRQRSNQEICKEAHEKERRRREAERRAASDKCGEAELPARIQKP